jgi:hypothetical protein
MLNYQDLWAPGLGRRNDEAFELSLESDPTSIETQEELAVAYILRGRTAKQNGC